MCLKEYRVFTFTNRDAYERLLLKLKSLEPPESGTAADKAKSIKGLIKEVRSFVRFNKENWDKIPFTELEAMEKARGFFSVYYYAFWDWESFAKVEKQVSKAKYLFGKVTVEVY